MALQSLLHAQAFRLEAETRLFWIRQGILPIFQRLQADGARWAIGRCLRLRPRQLDRMMHHIRRQVMITSRVATKVLLSRALNRRMTEPLPVRLEGLEHWRRARESGRGVALCGMHFGAFGLGAWNFGRALGQIERDPEVLLVVRPGQAQFARLLEASGSEHCRVQVLESHSRTYVTVTERLRGAGVAAELMDGWIPSIRPGAACLPIQFLNHPVLAPKGLFWSVVNAGAMVLPYRWMLRDGELTWEFFPPLEWDRTADRDAQIREVATRFYRIVEAWIASEPWLWDRWDYMPGGYSGARSRTKGGNDQGSPMGTEALDRRNAGGSSVRFLARIAHAVGLAAPAVGDLLIRQFISLRKRWKHRIDN